MKDKFKVGDIVECVYQYNHSSLCNGHRYCVEEVGYSGLYVSYEDKKYYGFFNRFEVVTNPINSIDKSDYKNIQVGDRILFLGDKGSSYIEMTVAEIADKGQAIKNSNGYWYRVSPLPADTMNFKEILPKK